MKNFLFLFLFFFSINLVFADATSTLATTSICTSLNSLFPYNKANVRTIQTFIKEKYFDNLKVTGIWDLQTKKYVKKLQFSFDMAETGKLNDPTLNFLRGIGHCFLIEGGIVGYPPKIATTTSATSTSTSTKNFFTKATAILTPLISQKDLVQNIIKTFNVSTATPPTWINNMPPPQLKLTILDSNDDQYKYIHDSISNNSSQTKDLTTRVANKINLTSDLNITFENCNNPNAYFDNQSNKVVMCYEYIDFFVKNNSTNLSLDEKINEATNFTLLHTIGHALIFDFDLPTTGKEEVAADEFAMYFLTNYASPVEIKSIMSGIKQFYYLAINPNLKNQYLNNLHAPTIPRYYDLLAFYVGAFTNERNLYVGNESWQLDDTKAENIDDDYSKKIKTWTQLLVGHIKY